MGIMLPAQKAEGMVVARLSSMEAVRLNRLLQSQI